MSKLMNSVLFSKKPITSTEQAEQLLLEIAALSDKGYLTVREFLAIRKRAYDACLYLESIIQTVI